MGVIDSISAGYRFLFRRPQLLFIPVLLDLFLWLMPRLSVAPLFAELAQFYRSVAQGVAVPGEATETLEWASTLLLELGAASNLFDLLVNSFMLHVPSLLTTLLPLPSASIIEVTNPLTIAGLSLFFALLSLLIGVIYISMLAQNLPIGEGPKPLTAREFAGLAVQNWLRVLRFVLIVAAALLALYIPAIIAAGLLSLLSPAIGSVFGFILGGLTVMLFFYLYFTSASLIMDNTTVRESMMRSVQTVRESFWASLGFVILINIIRAGFDLLLNPLAAYTPAGTFAAILAHAYIGTGLVIGLLVFYRTRQLKLNDLTV